MNTNTLTDFLQQAQCQFQIYDLGRKVTKISNTDFQKVAENTAPYPYPIQQHAYFGLTFWQINKGQQEHFVWFLKLPLDEQGLMKITAQTSFIKMVIEAMGENLTAEVSDKLQQRMASNPFIFKPAMEKLAIFNALMNTNFVRPASTFYPAAQQYFSGKTHWDDQWQSLGFQGIADLSARLNYDNNQQTLINALPHLPQQPLQSLALCLEHQQNINPDFAQAIAQRAQLALQEKQTENAILLLRAISSITDDNITKSLLEQQFNSDLIYSPDWYVCIAGRCWSLLQDETLLNRFFEALANHQTTLFPQLFSDLVAIPALREKVLKQLRLTARSPALSEAIGLLFSAMHSETNGVQ